MYMHMPHAACNTCQEAIECCVSFPSHSQTKPCMEKATMELPIVLQLIYHTEYEYEIT